MPILIGNLRSLYDWSRRLPRRCEGILEIPAFEEACSYIFARSHFYTVWTRGQLLSKVWCFCGQVFTWIVILGVNHVLRFNWASRKLYKRLLQLGANELYSIGEADEQHPEG